MDAFEKLRYIYTKVREVNDEPREQAPLNNFAIRLAFDGLGLPLNPALEKLYSWHNGIWHVNAFLSLLPLGEAVKTYRAYLESNKYGSGDIGEKWFPVIDENGDYQYCIDLDGSEVWRVDLEDGSRTCVAKSYENCLDALIAAFDRGLAQYDSDHGYIFVEDEAWEALCSEFGIDLP